MYDLMKEIPNLYEEYPFLKEVDSMSLRCAIFDLENGFKRFYEKQGGYPRFKKKWEKESYRTNYLTSTYKGKKYENIKVDLRKKEITLPKLKEVKIRGYRNLEEITGRIINATVEKEGRRYYVSVVYEEERVLIANKEEIAVGIDIGVKNLVVTSDKEYYGNPRYQDKYNKRIIKLQRKVS